MGGESKRLPASQIPDWTAILALQRPFPKEQIGVSIQCQDWKPLSVWTFIPDKGRQNALSMRRTANSIGNRLQSRRTREQLIIKNPLDLCFVHARQGLEYPDHRASA